MDFMGDLAQMAVGPIFIKSKVDFISCSRKPANSTARRC
jgi:hypothetical protein